jgi:predicted TPR repeat methyltransferase
VKGVTRARGQALLAAGNVPAAIAEFIPAVERDPGDAAARFALGCAWLELGEASRAIETLTPIAATKKAAAKISDAQALLAVPRSPAAYVRHLFDQFSADYDRKMVADLSYAAPAILRGLADLVLAPRRRKLAMLDLGCGTGLAGVAFQDLASRLDGIDLSPAMIDRARQRKIYESLDVADIEIALTRMRRTYDLILAADTLVYLGDLAAAFRAVHERLKPGGHFLFTVEKKKGRGFVLGEKRRYRHSATYLRTLAQRTQLEVMGLMECWPRREAKVPVEGFAVALARL